MKTLDRPWGNQIDAPHHLEFYRPGEAKPFQVLYTRMHLDRQERVFSGSFAFYGGDADSTREEIKSIEEQLKDTTLSAEDKADLQKQLGEQKKRLEEQAAYGTLEVECSDFKMRRDPAGPFSIEVNCGDSKVGTLKASGNIKFIGA
jgi:hypothetical protein